MDETTLDQLAPGNSALVTTLGHTAGMNRRLRDLGLIEGTRVECLYQSPWGSPTAYCVRGAVIAIRAADSRCIGIQML